MFIRMSSYSHEVCLSTPVMTESKLGYLLGAEDGKFALERLYEGSTLMIAYVPRDNKIMRANWLARLLANVDASGMCIIYTPLGMDQEDVDHVVADIKACRYQLRRIMS